MTYTTAAICALSVACGQDRPSPAAVLGSQRARFGDLSPSSGIYVRTTFDTFPTRIYFPEGRSDQRFYINGGQDDEQGRPTLLLQFETRVKGKPTLAWEVPLDIVKFVDAYSFNDPITRRRVPIPATMKSAGTMIKLLWRSGYKLHGTVNSAVSARLNAQEGYAGYSLLRPVGTSYYYWFVDNLGNISHVTKWSVAPTQHRFRSTVATCGVAEMLSSAVRLSSRVMSARSSQ